MADAAAGRALFVYGSLQLDEVVEAVIGRRCPARPATLPGYRRRLLRDRSYPGVLPDSQASTEGVLLDGLSAEELAVLDRFEGEPYERRVASLRLAPVAAPQAAFVYVVRDDFAALMTDVPWDLDRFRAESLPGFLEQCRAFRREEVAGAAWRGPA